jgi:hypothetical protein
VIELGNKAGVTVRLYALLEIARDLVDRAKVGFIAAKLEAIDGIRLLHQRLFQPFSPLTVPLVRYPLIR